MNNFLGKYFNWWMGVVEDINDPLKLSRVKVRIAGVHTDQKSLLPTKSLPWATISEAPNGGPGFRTLKEGDFVWGFFLDQTSSQSPVVAGVFPGIQTHAPDISGSTVDVKERPVSVDAQPGADGKPTTPPLSYGQIKASAISRANGNLAHACDFKYQINFGFGIGGLLNPITEFSKAIKNGKLKGAAIIRSMLYKITEGLRVVMKAITAAMGLDPTGELSLAFSMAKKIVSEINAITKKIAQFIEDMALYVGLVEEIGTIIKYLTNLPERIKKLVQDCIAQFLKSVSDVGKQIMAIPGQIESSVMGAISTLTSASQQAADALYLSESNTTNQTSTTTTKYPAEIANIFSFSTQTLDHVDVITTYFATARADANTLIQDTITANGYVRLALQSP